MISALARGSFTALLIALFLSSPAAAADLEQYRDFRLGSTVAAVTASVQARSGDLKTTYERPALLQELAWRPKYTAGRALPDADPVREIVFSFVNDQLFRIAIAYDKMRTTGLRDADMVAALTAVYGASSPIPAVRARSLDTSIDAPSSIAQWKQGDAVVVLERTAYSDSFGLQITSVSRDAIARKGRATAIATEVREAPAREVALRKKQADDQRAADEKTRSTNKEAFRP